MSDWSVSKEKLAWTATYLELQERGEEYYFCNSNGFRRCLEEARAGVERAEKTWAMYLAKRMTT